jgi:protein-S-isoprenylcysteine O-methyltransferase Ste14
VRTQTRALVGSAVFFLAGPLLEAGVGPWLITGGFARGDGALDTPVAQVLGAAVVLAGLAGVAACFAGFVRDGVGTPSPLAPTRQLVVSGPYRHVRNPMYVATAAIIVGEGLVLARPVLPACAALYLLAMGALVRFAEEPQMDARFGARYAAYRAAVPGWWPRLRPWVPGRS